LVFSIETKRRDRLLCIVTLADSDCVSAAAAAAFTNIAGHEQGITWIFVFFFFFFHSQCASYRDRKETDHQGSLTIDFFDKEKTLSAQKGQQNFQGEIFYNVQFARTVGGRSFVLADNKKWRMK
jgi:hypothetical protein